MTVAIERRCENCRRRLGPSRADRKFCSTACRVGPITAAPPTTRPPGEALLREYADAWQAARVDVSEGTAQSYRVALGRLLPRFGDLVVSDLSPQHVAGLVAELADAGLRKQTIRKTVSVLAIADEQELDYAKLLAA